ncbi:hypothetical protein BV210_12825 [Halorientalis sp. IM1011]|uniref:hypothetical protein n=1 Tax=Halorientalis sp. IM1011 TaxID=1932360 RepID=UPI00097CC279|nr:hypothetical protein [Halorientalis sp. IM1011]AQL43523.1 hypothetical protein BV210_12825 [Halorientalis sp. IM1011]
MLDRDNSTTRIVSGVVQILAIAVVGIVVSVLIAAFTESLAAARTLATIAGALGTVVLLVIVGWYARRLEEATAESRKLRRRPYVKRIVATGIDRILEWLTTNRDRWDRTNPPAGMPTYPEIEDTGVPDDVVADISRDYPDLVSDVSAFLTASREYRDAWQELHTDLSRIVDHAFELSDPPEVIDDVVPQNYEGAARAEGVDPWAEPNEFVDDHPRLFARLVLTNPEPSLNGAAYLDTEDYAVLLVDEFRREFMNLRGEDEIADQIDLVHRKLETLKENDENMEERLQDVRSQYLDEYEIMETELGEIRAGGRSAV